MANFEVLSLDPTTPQIRAPGAGDGYSVPRDMTVASGANLTLSGGTANGVLYLNGSKVATSGSALTFDGSTLTNTGNSTGTIFNTIVNTDAAGSSISDERIVFAMGGSLGFGITGWANAGIVEAASTGGLYLGAFNGPINFASGASARNINMTLTASGNLGIGTTSPAAKLHVNTGTNQNFRVSSDSGIRIASLNDAASATVQLSIQGSPMLFLGAGGAERMRLDASGNLGLGVTPSAFSTGKAMQIGALNGITLFGFAGGAEFGSNFNFDSSYKYTTTGASARYTTGGGTHAWYIAPSGTAGNAITFTQAMTLDASGNLGIGTTSPSSKLVVKTGTNENLEVRSYSAILGTGTGVALDSLNDARNSVVDWAVRGTNIALYGSGSTPMTFYTNSTARAYISSVGDFGIGTTSPTNTANYTTLHVVGSNGGLFRFNNSGGTIQCYGGSDTAGGFIGTSTNHPFILYTNGSEKARITAAGNVGIGTSSPAAKLDVSGTIQSTATGSAYAGYFNYVGATGQGVGISSNGVGSSYAMFFFNNGVSVGNIYLTSTTTTYNTSSDRRLKNNIAPSPSASNVIDAIEIVSHGWKAAPDKRVTYGVIAQDLAKVAPEAVTAGDDGEEVKETWGVDYSKLVPMLIKEMQSLRKRVAELEAR